MGHSACTHELQVISKLSAPKSVVFDVNYELIIPPESKIQVVVAHEAWSLTTGLVLVKQCHLVSLRNLETLPDLVVKLGVLHIRRHPYSDEIITEVNLDLECGGWLATLAGDE